MAILDKPQQLGKIVQAVNDSGWSVLYISEVHPFKLVIYDDQESCRLKIYIWNLTPGGGSQGTRRPKDEYRIQAHVPNFEGESGYKTLVA